MFKIPIRYKLVQGADKRFVQNFTKTFTSSISTVFVKETKKMSENGEIYTVGKNFTLPTRGTNFTSELMMLRLWQKLYNKFKHLMLKRVVPLTSNRKSTP